MTAVVDLNDYSAVAKQITSTGNTTRELRHKLAVKAFAHTAAYDAAIAAHLGKTLASAASAVSAPPFLLLSAPLVQTLRYGENPHQRAALYGRFRDFFEQLHGKELSYNNLLDLTAAVDLIEEFPTEAPTLAILKHTNPCGVGRGATLREAWDKALATDRQAPFGGIIVVNGTFDRACAEVVADTFTEVIVAPEFAEQALSLLQKKKNVRLLRIRKPLSEAERWEIRSVGSDSFLWQERDPNEAIPGNFRIVTRRQPAPGELEAMLFGWRVVKHLKSNAVVYAAKDRTLGIGAGQMSRVDASRIAAWKASEAGLSLKGSAVCSDGFFPFADGLIAAAEAGATAAIQPGGSVRDAEVISAADEHGIAMAFTGIRHFRH